MPNPNLVLVLCFLIALSGCNQQTPDVGSAQVVSEQSSPKLNQPQGTQPKGRSDDFDEYFTETDSTTVAHGPISITRNILQSRNGEIWLATYQGILRYDGKSFTNLVNKDGLRRFRAFSLLEDQKGNIWFGTMGQAFIDSTETLTPTSLQKKG